MSTVLDVKAKAWSPAIPCKIPDNIISSQFASQKVFIPSYEKEKRPCIEQLLTNEYQRMWWQEKESWDKRYSSKTSTKKLLQRGVIRRKPQTVPVVGKSKIIRIPKKKKIDKAQEKSNVEGSKVTQKEEERTVLQAEEKSEKNTEDKADN